MSGPSEINFHFECVNPKPADQTRENNRRYRLVEQSWMGQKEVMSWPMNGYTREKALNRADRYVGEQLRRSDPEEQTFTYTQEVPVI